KGSRVWRRLQRRKTRFLAQQKRRARDMEHTASRAVGQWAQEREVRMLVSGDVRDVAAGKRLKTTSQQQSGRWGQGRQRQSISSKAEAAGLNVVLCSAASTSQTGPKSGHCTKPQGRVYRCPACGFVAHRDAGGAATILSQHYTGEPGHVVPPDPTSR